jgi:hypothetical protein
MSPRRTPPAATSAATPATTPATTPAATPAQQPAAIRADQRLPRSPATPHSDPAPRRNCKDPQQPREALSLQNGGKSNNSRG